MEGLMGALRNYGKSCSLICEYTPHERLEETHPFGSRLGAFGNRLDARNIAEQSNGDQCKHQRMAATIGHDGKRHFRRVGC